MTFKEKLVRLRKLKALTQDEFASAVGVSRQAVYKWESGQSYPEVPKLLEIKMLFGVSIDDLLDETYEVQMPEKKRRKRISRADKERIEKEVLAEENALDQTADINADENTPSPEEVSEPLNDTEAAPEVAEVKDGNVDDEPVFEANDTTEAPSSTEVEVTEASEADEPALEPEKDTEEDVTDEVADMPIEDNATAGESRDGKEAQKKGFFARIFGKK